MHKSFWPRSSQLPARQCYEWLATMLLDFQIEKKNLFGLKIFMPLSTLFFNDCKCLKIKTFSVFSSLVYTAAIMMPQQNNRLDF